MGLNARHHIPPLFIILVFHPAIKQYAHSIVTICSRSENISNIAQLTLQTILSTAQLTLQNISSTAQLPSQHNQSIHQVICVLFCDLIKKSTK